MDNYTVIIAWSIAAVSVIAAVVVSLYYRKRHKRMVRAIWRFMDEEKQMKEKWMRTLNEKEALERQLKIKPGSVDRSGDSDVNAENTTTIL